jgi:hypothetical protein
MCEIFHGAVVEPNPLLLWPFIGLLYQPYMTDDDDDNDSETLLEGISGRGYSSTQRKPAIELLSPL